MRKNTVNKKTLFKWAKDLFPINRSLSGPGNYKTLIYLKRILPNLKIKKIKTGKKINSWIVPKEWEIKDAYIKDSLGKKVVDFKQNNLHVIGYSQPKYKKLSFKSLEKKLYFLKDQPNAIPYITSYYKKDWGFCISYNKFKKLRTNEKYKVKIDCNFKKGNLVYGEAYYPGKSKKEILICTNICHPSLANNELSGPVVSTALGKYISFNKKRFYSYRILYLPETIGSIAYINKNKSSLKKNVIAGFVVVCVGDNKKWSFLKSPRENTLADNVSEFILKQQKINYKSFNFETDRGSDERQFCWPGIDLPICSIMRSKYGTYKEYHTSLDNLKFISEKGLWSSFKIYTKIFDCLELHKTFYMNRYFGKSEPFLTKYKLIDTLSSKSSYLKQKLMMQIIYFTTSPKNLIDLIILTKEKYYNIKKILDLYLKRKLIKKI